MRPSRRAAATAGSAAALLLPLTGEAAAVGLSMQRAARLAQASTSPELSARDTAALGAGPAAREAAAGGATLLLGPLFGREVAPVLAAAPGATALTFSNDGALAGSGAFLLGVTPSQTVTATLAYARSRGVRSVAVVSGADPWSTQAAAAARRAQGGVAITVVGLEAAQRSDPVELLRGAPGGELPDAVLFTDADSASRAVAARLMAAGELQMLGTSRWLDGPAVPDLWVAAPDPAAFSEFSQGYQARYGTAPGALAGLAFDAVTIARAVQASGAPVREALLTSAGFPGVLGAVRFRADGSCVRDLAVLAGRSSGYEVVDRIAAA